jgi:hypothetical protein
MADPAARETLEFEMLPEWVQQFNSIHLALGHDEPEETIQKLIEIGVKAISLTDKDHPVVCMYNRDPNKPRGDSEVDCPSCKTSFVPNKTRQQDDGYKEVSVSLL